MTLRTHELPAFFGGIAATIEAASDAAFRRLLGRFVAFYAEKPSQSSLGRDRQRPTAQPARHTAWPPRGSNRQQVEAIWQPFLGWVQARRTISPSVRRRCFAASRPATAGIRHFSRPMHRPPSAPTIGPARPRTISSGQPTSSEAGHFIHGFESAWLPASLLRADRQAELIDALIAAARHSTVELHFQKGLAGGTRERSRAARDTATNPAVLDAFALAIIASEGPPAYPGLARPRARPRDARRNAKAVARGHGGAYARSRREAGSYVAESSLLRG